MQKELLQKAERCLAGKRRFRTWRNVVCVLACVVAFCTTAALVLPAITMGNTVCGLEEHIHTEGCYKQTTQVHTPSNCYTPSNCCTESNCARTEGKGVPVCQLPEHIHTKECYIQADNDVVIEAVVVLEGEDAGRQTVRMIRAGEQIPGDIADYLTSARIEINGEPYDGVSALNPGEQFVVALQWQLEREDLTDTLTYTYTLPEQIKVKDVEQTILYDENHNRKGVYSVTDGVLTVTYDSTADLNTTTFKLNASWDQEEISQETTVAWNGTLSTRVKFDNARIAVTKGILEDTVKTLEDGSLVGEYAVHVKASGPVENITLTDELTSETFHFYKGNYENNGEYYDYRYRITDADGSSGEYQYGNFPEGISVGEVTFPVPDLQKGQTYTVEYAVCLDADDRFELDKDQSATKLTNRAAASCESEDGEVSSEVTVTDTYRAGEKWLIKEKGNLSEGDVDQDTDVPWTVRVNPGREYAMGGAVIGDTIETEGVYYKTDKLFTVTSITDSGSDSFNPQWIVSDEMVSAIWGIGGQDAIDRLYGTPDGAMVLKKIEETVGGPVPRTEISNYVFVSQSKNQFVWFTPETETPATYELSYITDVSGAASNVLKNSAAAGWKQWTSGVVVGSFLQEVEISKENDGVYARGDDYFCGLDHHAECSRRTKRHSQCVPV